MRKNTVFTGVFLSFSAHLSIIFGEAVKFWRDQAVSLGHEDPNMVVTDAWVKSSVGHKFRLMKRTN
jgi:hypothetical protein